MYIYKYLAKNTFIKQKAVKALIITFVRTIISYICVIFALRVMGKRQIGELQPTELVVAIMISDLAALPMGDTAIPLWNGIVPILTLVVSEITLSFLSLKSERIRNIISGTPSIIIQDGKLIEAEMKKTRYTIDDIMEELRMSDYMRISDIHLAVLETNGELSVIPKSAKKAISAEDMGLNPTQEEMPYIIIADGVLRKGQLKKSGFDIKWVNKKIKGKNIKDVFLLTVDTAGNMDLQFKEGK